MTPSGTADEPLRCGVLGEVVLVTGSRTRGFGRRRTAEVLAALLVDRGRSMSVDDVVAAVWGDEAPPTAATMVHGAVRRLRTMADEDRGRDRGRFVISRAGRYEVPPEVGLDAAEFEALVAEARPLTASSPARAARLLDEALALWRGPAYEGIEQALARDEAGRLEELRRRCAEMLAEVELALDEPARAVAVLEPVVTADPCRERSAGLLMLALARTGRPAEALRLFERVRVGLVEALGVAPGPELREIEAGIRTGGGAPARRGPPPPPQRPPVPVSSFVGREDDLGRIAGLLTEHRLVTVTGPGGSGKTRLAVEAALRNPTRAAFVDLTRSATPDRFDDIVAEAIGIRTGAGPPAVTVARALADESILVVLDNAEHVLDRCADFTRDLLGAAPSVRVLVTARERLGLPGECVHLLGPLPVPHPRAAPEEIGRSPAVRLFVQRARAVRPGFALAAEDVSSAAEICRRLDGLPLALELAAARAAALSLSELEAALGDRFRLLTHPARHDAASRRAGLAATIAWSRDLLDDDGRRLLAGLGVFPVTFDLPAVRAVMGDAGEDPAPTLARLVDTSLVQVDDVSGDRWRYRMFESTREFARTCLARDELAVLRRRHADHFLGVCRRAVPHLYRAGAGPWLDALHRDRDNLRAALAWADGPDGDTEVLVGLCTGLWHYWDVRGSRAEGVRLLATALSRIEPQHPERMGLLSALALLHLGRGEFGATETAATEQHRLARAAGDRRWEGDAQALRATVDWACGRFDRAQQRYEDAIAASLAGGDVWRAAMAEAQLARLHRDRGEPDAARALARCAAAHAAEVGEELAQGLAGDVLASIEQRWGDPATARRLVETALEHYRLIGYREGEASALALSGRLAVTDADPEGARICFEQAHDIFRRIGHRAGVTATADGLAALDAPGPRG
ncbi:AAA family ATPase [Actinomycetospora endophytica]|uniref:AAA family ATPase n=1 Tax=Actinomycetospora endophytica TaxID=2291215 RepID=A0ABS8PDT6_9PSEU|nr:BTAD domain-containing putative transcriptional regulator [Actinomycetospora endophytica]MCD2195159.1 AAA family ATPase [Actinomycetospora endophytica]